ncbi:MAG: hypothetical protein GQ474_01910 [Sulfurimonas sp.]|nr:hypothetical protein [Sulfurimonas sp.]
MQQNTIVTLLASLVGLVLSGKWMSHEVKFVSMMSDAEMDISWLLQAPLMLFIAIIFIFSLLLFFGSIMELKPKELFQEVSWKRSVVLALIFNAFIGLSAYANTFLEIKNKDASITFVALSLILLYIFGARKHNITPIFFLISTFVISAILWSLLFFIF